MKPNINQVENIIRRLFPLCRSVTGKGTKKSLKIIKELVPELKIKSIASGKKIFDWTVPSEWNVKDAYVKNSKGEKVIDFKKNNIHLVGYSEPYSGILSKKKILQHIHTIPNKPNWIPYRTSYYKKYWGFCCKHSVLTSDKFVGPFEVLVDTELDPNGKLNYGEAFKKGEKNEEIVISTYCCHPSLANDNISGLITAALLFNYLKKNTKKFSYRLAIVPETIGSLCFLKKHPDAKKIVGGTIVTTTAGPGKFSIKESFNKDHWINRISHSVLSAATNNNYITYPFDPDGSDERQYSSPMFRIPTPSIHKSRYCEYDEYHTSADNLNFISAKNLLKTLNIYCDWINAVDRVCLPKRKNLGGELQLGKRGLYPNLGGIQTIHLKTSKVNQKQKFNFTGSIKIQSHHLECFQWLMHLCDGNHSNFDIAERSGLNIKIVNECIEIFKKKGLITI